MNNSSRNIGLYSLLGCLAALVLLAASLSNLQFLSGTPFPGGGKEINAVQSTAGGTSVHIFAPPILRGLLAFVLLASMLYVTTRLIRFVKIKKTLLLLFATLVLFALAYLIPGITPGQVVTFSNETSSIPTPSVDYPVTLLGQPPRWLIWLVIFVIGMGVGLFAFKMLKGGQDTVSLEDQLLNEAEVAANDIKAGVDLSSVVIRCYLKMVNLIQEEQGIERHETMTVQEFEKELAEKGFPYAPVHQLTYLFEKVRYSKQTVSREDEKACLDSLGAIIRFCRLEGG